MKISDASGYAGEAERVVSPFGEDGVVEILRAGVPVTVWGSGTGLTGGGVPQGGVSLSMERLNGIEVRRDSATVGAGAILRDIQAAAAVTRQFYAPDPTENSASIGGTIATNASGSRSFRYRDTRAHVRALRVVLAGGEVLALRRGERAPFELPVLPAPATTKNTAGYFLRAGMDYLDLFIGSEGTLGVVTEAEIGLLPVPESLFAGVVFFATDEAALEAVDAWRPAPGLRMLEYLDAASLELIRVRFGEIPSEARAAILVEAEGEDTEWLGEAGLEASWFGTGAADRERFRVFRHALPEAVNALIRKRQLTKMGSDFAVPVARNREMLGFYRQRLEEAFPGQYVIFGHIGDAHLHVNLLPAGPEEWQRGKALMTGFAAHAVALGGTVSAEHGLGKLKRDFLGLQYTEEQMGWMRSVKNRLDPGWLLGSGTLFER